MAEQKFKKRAKVMIKAKAPDKMINFEDEGGAKGSSKLFEFDCAMGVIIKTHYHHSKSGGKDATSRTYDVYLTDATTLYDMEPDYLVSLDE